MPSIINLICTYCKLEYSIPTKLYKQNIRRKYKNNFCSLKCKTKHYTKCVSVHCKNCDSIFTKKNKEIERTKNNFCSKSCAATYNNKHKTHGTRRSKFEQYLEKQLVQIFPDLYFMFNKKHIIKSELDIYIPQLNLALELNGIYHYKPIHGQKKYKQIKNNDKLKIKSCKYKNIKLFIINVSKLNYFVEKNIKIYYDKIIKIIKEQYEIKKYLNKLYLKNIINKY